MKPSDFTPERRDALVRTLGDNWAFVPPPLPPGLAYTAELVSALSAADRALGELAGAGRTLANPQLLIRPFMRREAVLSSRIEGTLASLSDLFLFEAAPSVATRVPDVQEVMNYVSALNHGLRRHKELPLSLRLIREMHERLMTGVRGTNKQPGEFRRDQNWIGPPGTALQDATYVPPPPPEMMFALDAFEKHLHAEPRVLPPLVRLATIHYQFEAIHPFLDGNGRIGRLLVTLILCIDELLPRPLLYLSAYFERTREEYVHHLQHVSTEGAWAPWIVYFLRGVTEQALDAAARVRKLLDLRQQYHEKFQTARSSARPLKLVDELFGRPVITVAKAADKLKVTKVSAQNNIDKLVDAGVLEEVTGRTWGRVWQARRILRAVDEPLTDASLSARPKPTTSV